MRLTHLLTTGLALLTLAGCAAAMPGYVPDKDRNKFAVAAQKAKENASLPAPITAADGSYTPTDKERSFNCRRLTGIIQIKLQQLRDEMSQAPASRISEATEQTLAKPMLGGQVKQNTPAEQSRDRARLVALNQLMIEKKCGHFDLESALDPANTASPEPIRPPGKAGKRRI